MAGSVRSDEHGASGAAVLSKCRPCVRFGYSRRVGSFLFASVGLGAFHGGRFSVRENSGRDSPPSRRPSGADHSCSCRAAMRPRGVVAEAGIANSFCGYGTWPGCFLYAASRGARGKVVCPGLTIGVSSRAVCNLCQPACPRKGVGGSAWARRTHVLYNGADPRRCFLRPTSFQKKLQSSLSAT